MPTDRYTIEKYEADNRIIMNRVRMKNLFNEFSNAYSSGDGRDFSLERELKNIVPESDSEEELLNVSVLFIFLDFST